MLLRKLKKDDRIIIDLRKSSAEELRIVTEILHGAAQTIAAEANLVMVLKKKSADLPIRA